LTEAFRRIDQTPEQGRDRSLFVHGMRIVHQQRNLPALMYYDDLDAAPT